MNLSTLRDQAAKFAGDPQRTRYPDADYLVALNRAQEQFALDTMALWKDKTWTSVSGQAAYDLPADFMFEQDAIFNGLPIDPASRRDFAILAPGTDWTLTTGTPTRYLVDPEEAQKKLLLYPMPTDNDAGKTISMRYFPLPTALASDSDIPLNSSALMSQFHIGLAAYAAWLLLLTEEVTPGNAQKRANLLSVYSDAATKATDLFRPTASAPWRMRGSRPV